VKVKSDFWGGRDELRFVHRQLIIQFVASAVTPMTSPIIRLTTDATTPQNVGLSTLKGIHTRKAYGAATSKFQLVE